MEYKQLQPHQQRVVDERNTLNENIVKLAAFLYSENFHSVVTSRNEQYRMHRQLTIMRDYSEVLMERIKNFN